MSCDLEVSSSPHPPNLPCGRGAEGGGRLIKHRITWQEALVGPHPTGDGLYNPGPFAHHRWVSVYPSLNDGVDKAS